MTLLVSVMACSSVGKNFTDICGRPAHQRKGNLRR
jgi:hypothetical protein